MEPRFVATFLRCACTVFACALSSFSVIACAQNPDANWPDFRGPLGNGHSVSAQPPQKWSESEQVRWKVAVSGRGWSSPVVWENQIWVTTSTEDGKRRLALAYDRESGALLQEVAVFEVAEPETINETNSFASPSPVIEAGRVYVYFGTVGIAAIDTATGAVAWKREDLKVNHKEGAGSSPLLAGDLIVLAIDGLDVQYVTALNKLNGETVWKTERSVDFTSTRDDMRKAFSTPYLHQEGERKLVISSGAQATMAYDLTTGQEIWKHRYNGFSNVGRPVVGHAMVYLNTGYMKPRVVAMRLGGSGEITDEACAWSTEKATPNKPSLLLADDLLYMVTDKSGVLTCLDAKTGEQVYQERLGGNFSASPVMANGLIYFCDEDGRTTVVRHGRTYEVVSVNELEDGCLACPAPSGRSLFLRTRRFLYRLGE
jgi:outer membrane protein assembly factor BamB